MVILEKKDLLNKNQILKLEDLNLYKFIPHEIQKFTTIYNALNNSNNKDLRKLIIEKIDKLATIKNTIKYYYDRKELTLSKYQKLLIRSEKVFHLLITNQIVEELYYNLNIELSKKDKKIKFFEEEIERINKIIKNKNEIINHKEEQIKILKENIEELKNTLNNNNLNDEEKENYKQQIKKMNENNNQYIIENQKLINQVKKLENEKKLEEEIDQKELEEENSIPIGSVSIKQAKILSMLIRQLEEENKTDSIPKTKDGSHYIVNTESTADIRKELYLKGKPRLRKDATVLVTVNKNE